MTKRTFTARKKEADDENVLCTHKQNLILLLRMITDQTSENKLERISETLNK